MKRNLFSVLVVVAALVGMPFMAQAAFVQTHLWNLGDNDPGAVNGGAANDPTLAAVGGFNLTRVGAPTYTTTPTGLGVDLANPAPDHNVNATDYFTSAAFAYSPTDPTKTVIHARVKLNTELTTESAVLHIGFGNSPQGIILETDGGVDSVNNAWMLHIPGVVVYTGGSVASAVGQYVDLSIVANGTQLQLYQDSTLVIDVASPGFLPTLNGLHIGGSTNGPNVTRGWDGQVDFVRIMEYTGDFDINAALNHPIPEPSGLVLAGMALMGLISMRRRKR